MEERKIYVFLNNTDREEIFVGTLYLQQIRNEETCSFEYDTTYIQNEALQIDPELELYAGRQYKTTNTLFGIFSDSAPDRWGRTLLNRRERLLAKKEDRKPRKLLESDYLLGIYDEVRMGALRFKESLGGPYLSSDSSLTIPPVTKLRALEEASRNYEVDEDPDNDKWIRQLIQPGSSLGGARPKATVKDVDDSLWIAKFPSKNDEIDIGAWEFITHELALKVGLNVPEAKLQKFSILGSTLLSKRFDRENGSRVHFASAMTCLKKRDGDNAMNGTSYLDLFSFIKSYGTRSRQDTLELFKRIIFSMCITNSDDHLRNHGFVLQEKGWILSPMYDVNPTPYGNELALNITKEDNQINKENIYELGHLLGYTDEFITEQYTFIKTTVKEHWESIARKYVSYSSIKYMRPAFDFCYK